MSRAAVRVGVGSRFSYDGEAVEVVEFAGTQAGGEVVLKDGRDRRLLLTVKGLCCPTTLASSRTGRGRPPTIRRRWRRWCWTGWTAASGSGCWSGLRM
ncbi:hypothetical protein ACWC4J_15620 [Streptomyces sp. NPDC001356]